MDGWMDWLMGGLTALTSLLMLMQQINEQYIHAQLHQRVRVRERNIAVAAIVCSS